MSVLSELTPKAPLRMIDMVRSAGVDIRDWGNFKGGQAKAASNPKYCYEWSFIEPGKVVVLNFWHASIKEHDATVSRQINMRERATQQFDSAPTKSIWKKRALRMDSAIQTAYRDQLPVRVIICEGEMRDFNDPTAKASQVNKRLLDPMPWAVTDYDWQTGQATITRGVPAERFIDQFSMIEDPQGQPEQRLVSGEVYVRNSEVRRHVLARARGKCEWCFQAGFTTTNGKIFLETHHVIPLSEGGNDTEANVVALCPNHHREAHHGANGHLIKKDLLERLTLSQVAGLHCPRQGISKS
jgi:5-methylcytosine-specific restriction enzyme A